MSPRQFRTVAVIALVLVALIVITGAAVRLSGSGLGCPDWPTCYHTRLTPQLSLHPMIEFGNRLVTVVLTIGVAVAFVASLLRTPRRRDLCWLSAGLVGGVIAQAVLGGIVVYTKLNPYLVMVHFLASMALLGDAVVLVHRSSRAYGPGTATALVRRPLLQLSRLLLVMLAVVLAAGTATTGAGPHAGEAAGQLVAKRIPVPLRDMAELHSTLALFTIGLALATAFALHALDVPVRVRRASRIFVAVLAAQAIVGYTQYFTHLPVLLVEVHIVGATALVIGAIQFHLSLTGHPREDVATTGREGSIPNATRRGTLDAAPYEPVALGALRDQ